MKISDVLSIYDFITTRDYPGLALGGYPALVAQEILPNDRETKDIDLCNFIPEGYGDPGIDINMRTESYVAAGRLNKVGFSWPFIMNITRRDKPISGRGEGDDKRGEHVEAQRGKLEELGIISAYSVHLAGFHENDPKIKKKVEYMDAAKRYFSGFNSFGTSGWAIPSDKSPEVHYKDLSAAIIDSNTRIIDVIRREILNGSTSDDSRRYSAYIDSLATEIAHMQQIPLIERSNLVSREVSLEECLVWSKRREEEINLRTLLGIQHFVAGTVCTKFMNATKVACKCGPISIDVFELDWSKMDKMSVIINDRRYVHYYLILKAKYEYCANPMTDEASFVKHINDLEKSFSAKPIKGINFPCDIERLVKAREYAKK